MKSNFDIPANTSATQTITVTREHTVAYLVPGMPEVYGTPFMIFLMEHAATEAIKPFLPPGWISVGTQVNVRHLAATPVGLTVTATATVVSASRNVVTFTVKAHDGVDLIGEGTHERAVVEMDRLVAKAGKKKRGA